MIITTVSKTMYKIEMTDDQAMYLHVYLNSLTAGDIDHVCLVAKTPPGTKEATSIHEALADLSVVLRSRRGS